MEEILTVAQIEAQFESEWVLGLNVVRVRSSARKTPEVESSADARTARGAANPPNSNNRTVNTRTTASASTISVLDDQIAVAVVDNSGRMLLS